MSWPAAIASVSSTLSPRISDIVPAIDATSLVWMSLVLTCGFSGSEYTWVFPPSRRYPFPSRIFMPSSRYGFMIPSYSMSDRSSFLASRRPRLSSFRNANGQRHPLYFAKNPFSIYVPPFRFRYGLSAVKERSREDSRNPGEAQARSVI